MPMKVCLPLSKEKAKKLLTFLRTSPPFPGQLLANVHFPCFKVPVCLSEAHRSDGKLSMER